MNGQQVGTTLKFGDTCFQAGVMGVIKQGNCMDGGRRRDDP
jgi:hypothetical protein